MPLVKFAVAHGRTLDEARRRLETAVGQITTQFGAMIRRVEWAADRLASGLKQIVQQTFQKKLP
jgi:hypothetical protein